MATIKYQIEILDLSLNKIAEVLTPFPLDKSGNILQYSKELSDYGQCRFRISASDPILIQYGDIIQPHKYHIRIRRNSAIVWQGAIIDNTKVNSNYIEIVAAEYLFYLSRVLVSRSSNDPSGIANNDVFRIFNSGTMATAVTAMMNETITKLNNSTNKNSILSGMTLGTIENPNYPPSMTDSLKNPLTGAWNFSTNFQLTYDFISVYKILKAFGIYSYADFKIDNNLVFSFQKFTGNDHHYDVSFTFTRRNSNIINYNLPRLGHRMVNSIIGMATNNNGVVLHQAQFDSTSISTYGLMEGTAAYSDVKDIGLLNARIAAELPFIGQPDETNVTIVLNETAAYPLGLWDIGDLVTVKIVNNAINFKDIRRVVGATVMVHSTGREITTVQTNKPLAFQYGVS